MPIQNIITANIVFPVHGQGYALLRNNVDYRIHSSDKNESPEAITGSAERAIHIELYKDIFMSERFLEVILSAQIVLSGLMIDTNRTKALQSFAVRYERRDIQYSGVMEDIMVIYCVQVQLQLHT